MDKKANTPSLVFPVIMALLVLAILGYLLLFVMQPFYNTEHSTPQVSQQNPELEVVPFLVGTNETEQQTLEDDADIFVTQLAPTSSIKETEHLDRSEKFAPRNRDTKHPNGVIITEQQGEFVRHDGVIVIPELEYRKTTIAALQEDSSLPDNTPVTLEYTQITRQQTTLEQISQSLTDKTTIIEIETKTGEQFTAPLTQLLNQPELKPTEPVTLIIRKSYSEKTTIGQLSTIDIDRDQPVIATVEKSSETFAIKDILRDEKLPDNALFYLHRVTDRDIQGLWGIIQNGLIQRFRQGLRLENINQGQRTVQVIIPQHADEPLPNGLSSFLGRILDKKATSSYIYNFSSRTMGQNPNLIYPGQQLIMIHFTEDELKQIYLFFNEQPEQNVQTFAIPY